MDYSLLFLLEKTASDTKAWSMARAAEKSATPRILSFLNAHAVTTAAKHKMFLNILQSSDWLLRDGIGVKLALSWLGLAKTRNLNGTDLIPKIIKANLTKRVAIFGSTEEAINLGRQKLLQQGVTNVVAMEHGFHPDHFYIGTARNALPEIVIICMGMPRQEILAAQLKEKGLGNLIICAGGWLDFYAGVKNRAPLWVRRLSLEWVHRLIQEPKRLGKRYTIDIIVFFYLIACLKLKQKKKV